MKKQLTALLVVAILAMAGSGAPGASGYIQLAAPPRQLGAGDDFPDMWEYVYDVIGNSTSYIHTQLHHLHRGLWALRL